jgi:Vitamin K-dependent gamma-carboxylase
MKTTTAHNAHTGSAGAGQGEEPPFMFFLRGVERFWFQPSDPTALGLMRITTGVIVLYVHLTYCIGLMGYVGPDTWIVNTGWTDKAGESGVTDYLRGNSYGIQLPSSTWDDSAGDFVTGQAMWSIYYHIEDPTWVWVIHSGILVVLILFTIGLWTRVSSVLAWIGALMYIQRLQGMLFGLDTMTNLALLYLMIAPCGAVLSVDRWLKVRRERLRLGTAYVPQPLEPLVSATFATRLIQINYCIIYAAAGTSKLLGTSWWNGTAPNRFLLNYSFAPFNVPSYIQFLETLVKHRWAWEAFCTFGVVFTLSVELGFPFLVWNRRLRWVMVCGSILLHTMIALLMGLVTFSLIMLCLVLAFVPPEAVRQGLRDGGEWVWQLVQLLFPRAWAAAKRQPVALSR